MGHRLSKIYTKTGDDGTTGLGDGSRVSKDHLRVEVFGTIDELNSVVGIVAAEDLPDSLAAVLEAIQHDLFDLGGELCLPGRKAINEQHVRRLETQLDALNADLPILKEFILPGGTKAAAVCHLARTVCRRAERRLVAFSRSEQVSPMSIQYLNRLSDLLFVVARRLNQEAGKPDVFWEPGKNVRPD